MELDLGPVNMSELPRSIEASFAGIAQKKGIQFRVFRTADVPDIIYSDEQRLMQVLRNLLSNAFKFTG